MFKRWALCLFFWASTGLNAAVILKGDDQAVSDETFSFRIQGNAISVIPEIAGMNVYVTAHPDAGGADMVKQFAVSRVTRDSNQFLGITPQEVKFNFASKVGNPLYDKGIAFFALFNGEENILQGARERPVVVLNEDKATIYLINNFTNKGEQVDVLSLHNSNVPLNQLTQVMNVPDAAAAVTSGITQLAVANPFIFAAVGVNGGSFGAVGSGIALGVIGSVDNFTGPLIIDAPTGNFSRATGNRAVALDVTSAELKIGANLASIGTIVDLHWHRDTGRLYIALQITGGGAGTDGGRAIAIGRPNANILLIEAIVPVAAITGTDKIIAAVESSAAVSIHKVRGMFSSTSLPYLIVAGNVGAPSATRRTVFALPLVSRNADLSLNGTIAAKDADPENLFTDTEHSLFITRAIKQPATTAAQMPLSSDAATQVGGGAIVNGDITDLFVHEDTVFATVQVADVGQDPGVFYSQAFFESNGKIKGWTTWRRAVGLPDRTQSVLLDQMTGQFTTLVADSSNEVKIVKRTEWNDGDSGSLSSVVGAAESFMPQAEAGVQGIHDFVVTSSVLGTATPGLLDISLLIATGLDNLLLAETSRVVAGAVIPTKGSAFGSLLSFDNGTITQTLPVGGTKIMSIKGGILGNIGPIVAAEIAQDGSGGSNGWLFVGGTGGVAVLSNANGSGWDTATGLSVGFTGLIDGMSFKTVGDFSLVRKLIYDDQFLYVLTNKELVRIDLTQGSPGLGSIISTVVATNDSIPAVGGDGSFLDLIISEKLALLGTSNGLFRLADGLNIRTDSVDSLNWQEVATPEGIGPVRQLGAISKTGRAQDLARQVGGGMLFALSAYRGKNQAQLFRYDIAQVTTGSIFDTTVRRIDDLFVENIPSYFVNFGSFQKNFATDGALFFGARSKREGASSSQAILLFSKERIETGSRFLSTKMIPASLEESTLIAGMIQNSASGSWLIAGDHGIRANE